jgi:uncharacterized protein YjbI with pentapeptide repeats
MQGSVIGFINGDPEQLLATQEAIAKLGVKHSLPLSIHDSSYRDSKVIRSRLTDPIKLRELQTMIATLLRQPPCEKGNQTSVSFRPLHLAGVRTADRPYYSIFLSGWSPIVLSQYSVDQTRNILEEILQDHKASVPEILEVAPMFVGQSKAFTGRIKATFSDYCLVPQLVKQINSTKFKACFTNGPILASLDREVGLEWNPWTQTLVPVKGAVRQHSIRKEWLAADSDQQDSTLKDLEQKQSVQKDSDQDQKDLYQKDLDQKDLDQKDLDQKELDQKDLDQKELDQKDLDQKELDQKDLDQKELDQKELDQKDLDQKELDQKDLDQKELDQKDLDQKDLDQKELDQKDLDQKDLDQKELDQKDLDQKELDQKDLDQKDLDQKDLDQKDLDQQLDSIQLNSQPNDAEAVRIAKMEQRIQDLNMQLQLLLQLDHIDSKQSKVDSLSLRYKQLNGQGKKLEKELEKQRRVNSQLRQQQAERKQRCAQGLEEDNKTDTEDLDEPSKTPEDLSWLEDMHARLAATSEYQQYLSGISDGDGDDSYESDDGNGWEGGSSFDEEDYY